MATPLDETVQKVQRTREKVEAKREQAKKARRRLEEIKEKVPTRVSQTALRQQMGGLRGRIKRREIKKVEERIGAQLGEVREFERGLEEFEEQVIEPVEAQIATAKERERAIKIVERAVSQGRVGDLAAFGTGLVQELAQQQLKAQKAQTLSQQKLSELSERVNITGVEGLSDIEKRQFDTALKFGTLKFQGRIDGKLKDIKSLQDFNKFVKEQEIKIKEIRPEIVSIPPQQVLSIPGTTLRNGLPTIPSILDSRRDVSPRVSVGDDKGFLSRVSGFISDNLRFEEGIKKEKEIFDPKTGMFITVSADPGLAKGTQQIISTRLPTEDEKRRIDFLESQVITANIPKLQTDIRRLEGLNIERDKLINKINELTRGKVNARGEFTGTEEESKEIQKLLSSVKRTEISIGGIRLTRTSSFFGFEREVQITRLKSPFGFINVQTEAIAGAGGFALGAGFEAVTDVTGRPGKGVFQSVGQVVKGEISPREFISGFGRPEPQAVFSLDEGIARLPTEADIIRPEDSLKVVQRREVEQLGELGLGVGKFFIPGAGGLFFASEVGEELAEVDFKPLELIKQRPIETALLGTGLLGLGALRAKRVIQNKAIIKSIQKEIKTLEKTKVKSLTIVDEQAGIVTAKGFRTSPSGIRQEVLFTGTIEKTDKGLRFIPEGKGKTVVTGVITPEKEFLALRFVEDAEGRVVRADLIKKTKELEPIQFIAGQRFEAGAKGTVLKRGKIGEVTIFEEVGITATRPERGFFGFAPIAETRLGRIISKRKLKKQLREGIEPEDVLMADVRAPIDQSNILFQVGKKLGIRTSPQETGIILTKAKKPKPTEFIKSKLPPERKTPLVATFGEDVILQEGAIEQITRQITPQISKTISQTATRVTPDLPLMVGGRGLRQIPFAGEQLFEQTQVEGFATPLISVTAQPVLTTARQDTFLQPLISTTSRLSLEAQQRELIIQEDLLGQVGVTRPKELTIQKETLALIEAQKQKQLQKQKLQEAQTQAQVPRQLQAPKPKTPKLPLKLPVTTPTTDLLGLALRKGEFKVKARKGGEDIEIGQTTTKLEAKELLIKTLKTTLRASGFVERGGQRVDLGFLGEGFRRSKKEPKRVVEIRQKRIKPTGISIEAKEIQLFRKQKGGKNAFF